MATPDKGPYYTSPDGTLNVWTGTGYHAIPKIAAADVGDIYTQPGAYTNVTPNGDGYQPPDMTEVWQGYGIKDYAKYGLPDSTKNFGGGALANYQQGSGDPEYLSYLLKSDDKVGTQIKFTKQGDYWVPEFAGAQGWDTNPSAQNAALLSIAAGPLLSYAGQALSGVPGTSSFGASGGLLNSVDDMLFTGAGAAGAGAVAPAASNALNAYGYLDTTAALPGTNFIDPFTGLPYGDTLTHISPRGNPEISPPGPNAPTDLPTGQILNSPYANPDMVPRPGGAPPTGTPPGTPPTPGSTKPPVPSPTDVLKNLSVGDVVKGLLTVGGAVLGSKGADGNSATGGSNAAAVAPGTIPKLYGGQPSQGLLGNYGPMGPTETERRMRKEYMPGLLGGRNPWGY